MLRGQGHPNSFEQKKPTLAGRLNEMVRDLSGAWHSPRM